MHHPFFNIVLKRDHDLKQISLNHLKIKSIKRIIYCGDSYKNNLSRIYHENVSFYSVRQKNHSASVASNSLFRIHLYSAGSNCSNQGKYSMLSRSKRIKIFQFFEIGFSIGQRLFEVRIER